MLNKALLAVAPATLFIAAPAPGPAHADETCTALANVDTADTYKACTFKTNARCMGTGGSIFEAHGTCTYPNGGRDECVEHYGYALAGNAPLADFACTYVPPGAP